MKLWFGNLEEGFDDLLEVRPLRVAAAVRAGDILPDSESWSNSVSWSASLNICIAHLLYNPNLMHEKTGAFTGQSGARSGHGKILAGRATADNIHRRQFAPIQFCNVPNMDHVGELVFSDFDRKGFNLAGPERSDTISDRCQREASNPIEEASHCDHSFLSELFVHSLHDGLGGVYGRLRGIDSGHDICSGRGVQSERTCDSGHLTG